MAAQLQPTAPLMEAQAPLQPVALQPANQARQLFLVQPAAALPGAHPQLYPQPSAPGGYVQHVQAAQPPSDAGVEDRIARRRVVCISLAIAVYVVLGTYLSYHCDTVALQEAMDKVRMVAERPGHRTGLVPFVLSTSPLVGWSIALGLLVPLCGYLGVKQNNSSLMGCFCSCNALHCCCGILSMASLGMVLLGFSSAAPDIFDYLERCDPMHCTPHGPNSTHDPRAVDCLAASTWESYEPRFEGHRLPSDCPKIFLHCFGTDLQGPVQLPPPPDFAPPPVPEPAWLEPTDEDAMATGVSASSEDANGPEVIIEGPDFAAEAGGDFEGPVDRVRKPAHPPHHYMTTRIPTPTPVPAPTPSPWGMMSSTFPAPAPWPPGSSPRAPVPVPMPVPWSLDGLDAAGVPLSTSMSVPEPAPAPAPRTGRATGRRTTPLPTTSANGATGRWSTSPPDAADESTTGRWKSPSRWTAPMSTTARNTGRSTTGSATGRSTTGHATGRSTTGEPMSTTRRQRRLSKARALRGWPAGTRAAASSSSSSQEEAPEEGGYFDEPEEPEEPEDDEDEDHEDWEDDPDFGRHPGWHRHSEWHVPPQPADPIAQCRPAHAVKMFHKAKLLAPELLPKLLVFCTVKLLLMIPFVILGCFGFCWGKEMWSRLGQGYAPFSSNSAAPPNGGEIALQPIMGFAMAPQGSPEAQLAQPLMLSAPPQPAPLHPVVRTAQAAAVAHVVQAAEAEQVATECQE